MLDSIRYIKLVIKAKRVHFYVLAVYFLMSVIICYPFLTDITHNILGRDNLLTSWTIGWNMHSFLNDPSNIFNANIFYPHKNTLAYSEGLFVPALIALPLYFISKNLILSYNILIFLSFILSAWGTFLLARYYTKNSYASFVAGIIFGFATYRIISLNHFQNLMIFWMPFSILYLQKYLDTQKIRYSVFFSICFIAQILSSWYNGAFLGFLIIYLLFVNYKIILSKFKIFLKGASISALLIITAVLPLAYPYLSFNKISQSAYSLREIVFYSADTGGYFFPSPFSFLGKLFKFAGITKERWLENINFLGYFSLILLFFYFVIYKPRKINRHMKVYGYGTIFFMILSFGPFLHLFDKTTKIPLPYFFIYFSNVFGFIRVPSRLSIIVLLCMAILVALVISFIKIKNKQLRYLLATIIPLILLFESFNPNIKKDLEKKGACSPIYAHIKEDKNIKSLVEFPLYDNPFDTVNYIFNSTCHYKPIFNGYSGYTPPDYVASKEIIKNFPDALSIDYLNMLGINHLLVHTDNVSDKASFLRLIRDNNQVSIIYQNNHDYLLKIKENELSLKNFYYNDFEKFSINGLNIEPSYKNISKKSTIGGRKFYGLIAKTINTAGKLELKKIKMGKSKAIKIGIQGYSYSKNDFLVIKTTDENYKEIIPPRKIILNDINDWVLTKLAIPDKYDLINLEIELLPSEYNDRIGINTLVVYLN